MKVDELKGMSVNPYRKGSKLYYVYRVMAGGKPLTLAVIANFVHDKMPDYCKIVKALPYSIDWEMLDRRVSSSLRTIRRECLGVCLVYDDETKCYQMTPIDRDSVPNPPVPNSYRN